MTTTLPLPNTAAAALLHQPLPSPPRTYHDPSGFLAPHLIQPPPPPRSSSSSSAPQPSSSTTLSQSYTYGSPHLQSQSQPPSTPSSTTPRQTHLFGHPLTHSLAPLLHNTLYNSTSTSTPTSTSSSTSSTSSSSTSPPWTYTARETTSLEPLSAAIHDPETAGFAVTMPLKVAALGLCDKLSPEAAACGAVNTVYFRTERGGGAGTGTGTGSRTRTANGSGKRIAVGANTDVIGVREALLRAGADPTPERTPGGTDMDVNGRVRRGKVGLVVGGGGAARTAVYALWKWLACGVVYVVCREKTEVDALREWFRDAAARTENSSTGTNGDPERDANEEVFSAQIVHVASVAQARGWETPDLVVGTVPDFEPSTEGERLAREVVVEFLTRGERTEDGDGDGDGDGEGEEKGLVLEMCYHPRVETSFYKLCKGAGWRVVPGTEAMVWQGVEQQVLWREQELGEGEVERAREVVLEEVGRRGEGKR